MNMSDSKAEFRAAFQERLRKDGVLDEITASIRSRILKTLLHEDRPTLPSAPLQEEILALLWIVHHFLEKRGYTHTLSVFAAESRLEHSTTLSSSDAIKNMGLQEIWDEFKTMNHVQTEDLISSLPAVVLWVNSLREGHVASEIQSAMNWDSVKVSTSVQTDEGSFLSYHESSRSNCNDFTIVKIESECHRRLSEEMNQKLRLSAKKQAIQATRRLEQKHKEELQALHRQIEVEKSHAKRREHNLTEELIQQQTLVHQQREIAEQRVQTITQEMHAHQHEIFLLNERVKVMQKQRFHEWTDEQDKLQEKTRASLIELQDDKRKLQGQMRAVSMQKDEVKSKELQFASLTKEKTTLQAEIQDLQHRQTAALALQQSLFDHKQSETRAQLETLRDEYIAAKAELDLSRLEVSGLQALLKQSQVAIESVSFRDTGPTSFIYPPANFSKNSLRPSVQLVSRVHSNFATNLQTSIINPSPSTTFKVGNGFCLRELKGKHRPTCPPYDASTPHDAILNSLPLTQVDPTESMNRTPNDINSSTRKRNQIIDPPCISSKDPPEMNMPKQNEYCWENDDAEKTGKHYEVNDGSGNFRGSLAGNEIVLNISSITDDFRLQDGSAAESIPSLVQVVMSGELAVAEDSTDKTNRHIQPAIKGALLIEKLTPFQRNEECVAESDQFECLPDHHQHNCSTSATPAPNKGPQLLSLIAISEPDSERHEEINPPSTMGDRTDATSGNKNEVQSKKNGHAPEPNHLTSDSNETHAIAAPRRSALSLASPDPQSEHDHSQTLDEEINSEDNRHEEEGGHNYSRGPIQSIYDPDLYENQGTENTITDQRSAIFLVDSKSIYSFEGHEPGCFRAPDDELLVTSTKNDPQRYKESKADSKSQSELTWTEDLRSNKNQDANNLQRSTTSLTDSEQYSEHFYKLDEENNNSSRPSFASNNGKAADPRSSSDCSENYSIEFSFTSEG